MFIVEMLGIGLFFCLVYLAGYMQSARIYTVLQNKGYKVITRGHSYGIFEYILADFKGNKTLVVYKKTYDKTSWVDQRQIIAFKNKDKCEFIIYATRDTIITSEIMKFFNENNIEVWDGKLLNEYYKSSNNNGSFINSGLSNKENENLSAIKNSSNNFDNYNNSTDSEYDDGPIIDGSKKGFGFFNNKTTRL